MDYNLCRGCMSTNVELFNLKDEGVGDVFEDCTRLVVRFFLHFLGWKPMKNFVLNLDSATNSNWKVSGKPGVTDSTFRLSEGT